jgi:ribonucleoside-diphosphate reductase alpha chain
VDIDQPAPADKPEIDARNRLPNRRAAITTTFQHCGANFTMTAGQYSDGRIGEIFINAGLIDSALDALASDAAIAISFALQHGADLAAVKAAMKRNSAGEPSSPIGAALAALDRIAP